MNRAEELRELRRVMGTAPETGAPFETKFWRGVEGIRLDLLDGPVNPYRAMYAMAVSTWGRVSSTAAARWEETSPEGRLAVVRAVLEGQALPLALEAPKFTLEVWNLSRWSFDQIARARVGTVFASLGTRDNHHLDMAFRMHEATAQDPERRRWFVDNAVDAKDYYRRVVEVGQGSWQEARTWLPISCVHRFTWSINYAAVRGFCGRRMSFSEAEDTVAVAWLIRERLLREDAYPLLGAYLRPRCDLTGACGYHRAHTMSEAFGCLFSSCGRNPVRSAPGRAVYPAEAEVADFNVACSDRETIARQLQIRIPEAREERPEDFRPTARDRYLFGFPPVGPEEERDFERFSGMHRFQDDGAFPGGPVGAEVAPRAAEAFR